jgi:hypothetical protein
VAPKTAMVMKRMLVNCMVKKVVKRLLGADLDLCESYECGLFDNVDTGETDTETEADDVSFGQNISTLYTTSTNIPLMDFTYFKGLSILHCNPTPRS